MGGAPAVVMGTVLFIYPDTDQLLYLVHGDTGTDTHTYTYRCGQTQTSQTTSSETPQQDQRGRDELRNTPAGPERQG